MQSILQIYLYTYVYTFTYMCIQGTSTYTLYIYMQIHPYIHTSCPKPFTYINQPMLEHLNMSNPTRVPYAYTPHLRHRYDNSTSSNVRTPLYHVPATLRDSHVMTGIRNHTTNPIRTHTPTLILVHECLYVYCPLHRQAYTRNPKTL